MRDFSASPHPADQADGLRRLFAQSHVRLVPVVSNPHMTSGGVLLEQLCAALADEGASMLLVDAAEGAPAPAELAAMSLAEGIETLAPRLGYLAARGLPMSYLDARGSTAPFLQAVVDAAPAADMVLVHASPTELSRLFARQTLCTTVRPVLLADDRPASVMHAYAAMKLLVQRAQLMVHHLLLDAAAASPRAERIARQVASCADLFLGATLHSSARIDPRAPALGTASPALRRIARALIEPGPAPMPMANDDTSRGAVRPHAAVARQHALN